MKQIAMMLHRYGMRQMLKKKCWPWWFGLA